MRRGRRAIAVAVAACGVAGCADEPVAGTRPAPTIDPGAGAPALVAGGVLLDATGRVARILPEDAMNVQPCPGGKLLSSTLSGDAVAEIRTLSGRVKWGWALRDTDVHAAACLDAAGSAIAAVTAPAFGRTYTLRIVRKTGSRRVRRVRGEIPLLTHEEMWVSGAWGLRVYAIPSGRLKRTLRVPPFAHDVMVAPGGRHIAFVRLDEEQRDRRYVVDTVSGAVREIEVPRATVIGWLDAGRLAVRADRRMIVLTPEVEVVRRISGFRPTTGIVSDGAVLAVDGERLVRVDPDMPWVTTVGRVPSGTLLSAPLGPGAGRPGTQS
jgi:hypothetical protein